MKMKAAVTRFYYDMTLAELQRMNGSTVLPKLSYNSLLYLDMIDMTPDCTVSKLAGILNVSKPAVTIKVRELMALGMIEKTQSEKDRRVFHLTVRPEVVKEYRDHDIHLRRAASAVEEKFTARDIDTFCRVLAAFSTAYNRKEE